MITTFTPEFAALSGGLLVARIVLGTLTSIVVGAFGALGTLAIRRMPKPVPASS